MSERTWGMVVWLGILGAIGAVIVTVAVYLTLKETTYALVFFIVAMLFALMGAVANVGLTRSRRQRWDGEMAAQQQRVDDLFASARADSNVNDLDPEARTAEPSSASSHGIAAQPIASEAAAEGESVTEEEGEHERAEHGGWE